ncbi:MAG: hypothetical protein PF961_17305 [Planctomycetota bacterium]|nr:hypothetical protein [Planctomycetota bacterium]
MAFVCASSGSTASKLAPLVSQYFGAEEDGDGFVLRLAQALEF